MHNELFTIGSVTIYGYGLMIAIGALSGVLMAAWRGKKHGKDWNLVFDISLWGLIAGLIGARLTYVLRHLSDFIAKPKELLGTDGYIVYGGVILGILVGALLCKIKKVSFLEMADLIIPSVALGQGFGRIGCFLAGCCYGARTESILGVFFPADSYAPSGVALWPTQLFSSAGDFLLVVILILLSRTKLPKGSICSFYLILYGIGRFLIEFLRDDERGYIGALTNNQVVSIGFVLLGGLLLFFLFRRSKEGPSAEEIETTSPGEGTQKEAPKEAHEESKEQPEGMPQK